MKSVKDLRYAADQERQRADADAAAAERRRATARSRDGNMDQHVIVAETGQAQQFAISAQMHLQSVDKMNREAEQLQERIVSLEGQKQQEMVAHQAKIDRFDAEIRQLRGE